MLKRLINYTDFNGEEHAKLFYFNLTSAEMMELSVSRDGDLEAYIDRITKANDKPAIIALVKDLILSSYGVKSEDGERFVKSERLREDFAASAAYSALFEELLFDDNKQDAFVRGILPPNWDETVKRAKKKAEEKGLTAADG